MATWRAGSSATWTSSSAGATCGSACRLIEAEGFEPVFPLPSTMRARLLSQWYVRTFHRETSRTLLELHWDIAERYWAIRFDVDAMWRRLEPMELPGATAFVPCAEDLLLMLCVHGVRHGSDKLEGIASIAELLRRTPDLDWERVWRESGEMHCRRILEFGLLLAHGLFDVPLPPQAADVSRSPALLAMARTAVRHFVADDPPSADVAAAGLVSAGAQGQPRGPGAVLGARPDEHPG